MGRKHQKRGSAKKGGGGGAEVVPHESKPLKKDDKVAKEHGHDAKVEPEAEKKQQPKKDVENEEQGGDEEQAGKQKKDKKDKKDNKKQSQKVKKETKEDEEGKQEGEHEEEQEENKPADEAQTSDLPVPSKREIYTMTEAYGEFWDHIKFKRGWDKPLFPKEEVEDLLSEAAEYVVIIRKILDEKNPGFKMRTLVGAAHEYLWKVQWHPWQDPDLFVKNLVHATFTDANGYLEDLTEEDVDRYMAQIKKRNQKETSKETEEKLRALYAEVDEKLQAVQQTWANLYPFPQSVADKAGRRHLGLLHSLINRLGRIQTDLQSVTERKEIEKAQPPTPTPRFPQQKPWTNTNENNSSGNKSADNEKGNDGDVKKNKEGKEDEKASKKDNKQEGKDNKQEGKEDKKKGKGKKDSKKKEGDKKESKKQGKKEESEEKPAEQDEQPEQKQEEVKKEKNEEDAVNPADLQPTPLERSASKSDDGVIKIRKVAGDVELMANQLQNLKEHTEGVNLHELPVEAAQKKIEEYRKRCLLLSEQLMKELLTLDQIVCQQETRSLRKAQVQHINHLLEDADQVKEKIRKLEEELKPQLELLEKQQEKERQEKEKQEKEKQKEKAESEEKKKREQEQNAEQQQDSQVETKKAKKAPNTSGKVTSPTTHQQQQPAASPTTTSPKSPNTNNIPTLADLTRREVWETLKLQPKFEVDDNEDDRYSVATYIPGMSLDDIQVSLEQNDSVVRIQGVRVPTPEDIIGLRKLAAQRSARGGEKMDVVSGILTMAAGRFGKFDQRFEIPKDVDIARISAAYRGGTFVLTLPKKVFRRQQLPARFPSYAQPAGYGYPPSHGRRIPGGRGGLFGDSDFFW